MDLGDLTQTIEGPNSPSFATSGPFNDTANGIVGPVGQGTASSTQSSDIDGANGIFSGTALATIEFRTETSDRLFAGSSYFVDFDLLVDHTFILTGLFENTQSGGFAQSFFNTFGPTNLAFGAVQSESVPVNETGVLLAGSYGLLVNNNINNGDQQPGFLGGTSSYQFDFRLTALNATPSAPEPGTLALLGLGLFGIGFSRRG